MHLYKSHLIRQFSSTAARMATEKQAYPTSFLAHLKTQKAGVVVIGMSFLGLSLSTQLVSYKQKNAKLQAEIEELREIITNLGGTYPGANNHEDTSSQDKIETDIIGNILSDNHTTSSKEETTMGSTSTRKKVFI